MVRRVELRDAEVGDLAFAALRDQQVGGFDVAVDDACVVRVAECVEQLREPAEYACGRHARGRAAVLRETRGEAFAAHVLHRDVGGVASVAVVVDGHDVRMDESSRCARLVEKARGQVVGGGGGRFVGVCVQQLGADRFERDLALDVWIERQIDHAHGAAAEHAVDAVTA